jgi:hypothetical protein
MGGQLAQELFTTSPGNSIQPFVESPPLGAGVWSPRALRLHGVIGDSLAFGNLGVHRILSSLKPDSLSERPVDPLILAVGVGLTTPILATSSGFFL